jgi:uncharacterized protein (TIGR02996 family)
MPDDPAFIRMIAANPDDDAPRLIYADVLEESGDEAKIKRAEFIRVQIERARLEPRTPRWNELWHRDTELLEWAKRWREELPAIKEVSYGGYIRGFIDKVTGSDELARNIRLVLSVLPLRTVGISFSDHHLASECLKQFAQVPVQILTVSTGPDAFSRTGHEVLKTLADYGPWPGLESLKVYCWAGRGRRPRRAQQLSQGLGRLRDVFGSILKATH